MSKRLTGLNPLAYIGVEAQTPPAMYLAQRAPTIGDAKNFNLGDLWLDQSSESLYVLVSLAAGEATWLTTFGGATSSFDTDNGTANELNGNINIVGDGSVIETSGSGDTVSIGLVQANDGQLIIGANGGPAEWGNLSSGDASIIITEGPNTIDLSVDASIVVGNGTNGQLLIGGGSNPEWASLTSDGSIIITPGVNTLQITAPTATGLTTLTTDSGTATQAAGNIDLLGDGITVATSGATDTVTIGLTNGTNGQLLIGGGANPIWANLTSSGATVTITNGANSINLETTGTGAGASQFDTDGASATEALGVIEIAGGNNIITSGAGNTVTIDLNGTTNHSLQVGNASGSLTSLAAATNGQIPIGRTGLDPVLATLTAGAGVSILNASGSITISAAGGGSSGMVVTTYNTPGSYTWTKNVDTKWVAVFGWTGGGGGGSGARGTTGVGGTGGGCGSFFRFSGPSGFFGASEPVEVGAGGAGGLGVSVNGAGLNGANGTPSSFGNVIVPVSMAVAFSQTFNQGGEGGNQFSTGGGSGGAFLLDSMSIYPILTGVANTIRNAVPRGGVAGKQTAGVGLNGTDLGGDGAVYYPFVYGMGTAGGAGGTLNSGTPNAGGRGGNMYALDGSTILALGGTAGTIGVAGGNGVAQPTSGGIIFGGTGGGGGGSQNGGTPAGFGGDGAFPGGGGGAGGGCTSGTSGAGGDGADGLVIVIEWT